MTEFVKLGWLEIGMLTHAFVSYVDRNIPFKLSSSNVLYTFLDAYQSAFDAQQRDKTAVNESSFISVSSCLYYCMDDCLNLLNGVRSEHPFIKINSINAEWLRSTGGIREVLMEMQFLLRLNVFRQQISLLLGERYIMTEGLFAQIESIFLQCMPVIEGSEMPFSQIPVSITGVPFIKNKEPLVGDAGILIRNKNILPCFRAISVDYMFNTYQLFTMYVSDWINIKPRLQAEKIQPAEKKQSEKKQPAEKKQSEKKQPAETKGTPMPTTGEAAYDDSELVTIFEKPDINLFNQGNNNTRKNPRSKKKAPAAAANFSSSSSSSSDGLLKLVQDANDFSLNPEPFEETTTNRERKYVFTSQDHQLISHKKTQIVAPLLGLFPALFVKEKISQTGLYLNIFHKKPIGQIDIKKSVAHLSLHPINDLYHFKITAFRQFNLHPPPTDKDYTISFKMHRSLDSGELSATIQPFVNNVETEAVCPAQTIRLFRLILDIMVSLLNANRGGVQTRRVIKNKKNKNKRTKKRN